MDCKICRRPMTLLFFSYACDHCDGLTTDEYDVGYIVWIPKPLPAEEFVFATRCDAERWRSMHGIEDAEIREVVARSRFRWRKSTGFAYPVHMAEHVVEVYENPAYPTRPYRAHFADPR